MPYKSPKKYKKYQAEYRAKHRLELNAYAREFHKAHRKRIRLRDRQWRLDNPEKYRERIRRNTLAVQKKKVLQVKSELEAQKNLCDLCGMKFTKANPPVRDHCHFTKKRWALLHSNCNLGIGHFHDSPELCILAAGYLTKWKHLLSR
jgi:hypothetical protein